MATLNIAALTPQQGTFRAKHPVALQVIEDIKFEQESCKVSNEITKAKPGDDNYKELSAELIEELKYAEANLTEFDLPDGSRGPCEIYVVGRNSKPYMDFMKKIYKLKKDSDNIDDLQNLVSDEAHKFLASLIVGWLDNGALPEYSTEAANALVADPANLWLIEQLQKFVQDESHFFLKTYKK